MKLTVIKYFLFILMTTMSPVVSSRERMLKHAEHGSNPVDGEALASKQGRIVYGEARRRAETESQFPRAQYDYEVASGGGKGKHSKQSDGGSKRHGCGSKSKSSTKSKSTKSSKSCKPSKSFTKPPNLCKNCWCDAGGDECPRFDLVAQYKGGDITFFRELGLPNNYAVSPSQTLCYPNLGHLPSFNNSYNITIPFLPLPQPPNPPLCKDVPDRMSSDPNAVCAFRYRDDDGDIIDTDYCSCKDGCWQEKVASYDLVTYQNRDAALAEEAFITHEGACGYCSTAQDLSVNMNTTLDFLQASFICFLQGSANQTFDIIGCVQGAVGFTRKCALAWVINIYFDGLSTDPYFFSCRETCLDFYRNPNATANNPDCSLNECLKCDEAIAGPIFAELAGRTRRNSGLLSNIARPCDDFAHIRHDKNCNID